MAPPAEIVVLTSVPDALWLEDASLHIGPAPHAFPALMETADWPPGRAGAIIAIEAPDASAVFRYVHVQSIERQQDHLANVDIIGL
jgi:hypothetical protein